MFIIRKLISFSFNRKPFQMKSKALVFQLLRQSRVKRSFTKVLFWQLLGFFPLLIVVYLWYLKVSCVVLMRMIKISTGWLVRINLVPVGKTLSWSDIDEDVVLRDLIWRMGSTNIQTKKNNSLPCC